MIEKTEVIDTTHYPSPLAGVDEAGRGCLAGPVVAAATILPENKTIQDLTDSKKISPSKRILLEQTIKDRSISWSLGLAWPREIERINILQASMCAMARALAKLSIAPAYVLVDGTSVPDISVECSCIKKGDSRVTEIAAASIIAKTFRDRLMQKLDKKYPQYCFRDHKGYATKTHLEMLHRYGPSKLHRYTYKPVQNCQGQKQKWLPGI